LLLVDLVGTQSYIDDLKTQFKESKIFFEGCDITKKEKIAELFKKYHEKFGYIDILVNSAGIVREDNIELTYQVNVVGIWRRCCRSSRI
jgi:NADP-dependent 3-hydroxy acid dehydrogenase YdfG